MAPSRPVFETRHCAKGHSGHACRARFRAVGIPLSRRHGFVAGNAYPNRRAGVASMLRRVIHGQHLDCISDAYTIMGLGCPSGKSDPRPQSGSGHPNPVAVGERSRAHGQILRNSAGLRPRRNPGSTGGASCHQRLFRSDPRDASLPVGSSPLNRGHAGVRAPPARWATPPKSPLDSSAALRGWSGFEFRSQRDVRRLFRARPLGLDVLLCCCCCAESACSATNRNQVGTVGTALLPSQMQFRCIRCGNCGSSGFACGGGRRPGTRYQCLRL